MERKVTLNRCRREFESLAYPLTRAEARAGLADLTLVYADGEEPFVEAVGRTPSRRFDSAHDLELELFMTLPVRAVGEPGQSEGDA